ncbi:MAG: hypothetical protein F6K62_17740 [Sphaerospermopsis sp. SIO1G2]|nr:hypothetical protein [Sphaerospermopsis sp. SIO1G2]
MEGVNAQNKVTTRRSDSDRSKSIESGMEEFPGSSELSGTRPLRVDPQGNTGEHTYHCPKCGCEDKAIGKILERLDALEVDHLKYVDAHQGRLRARLGESEANKSSFLDKANQLRTDIRDLMIHNNHCSNNNQ